MTDSHVQPSPAEAWPRREVVAATLLGALYVGAFWWRNGSFMDADEATVGLMARHIAWKHEWPVFFWQQEYMGAIEAYLAAVLFRLFGISGLVLKAVPALFTVAFIPIAADFAFLTLGRRAAVLTALLAAAPPLAFTVWSIKARGGFTESIEVGFAVMWACLRLVRSERHAYAWAVLAGLLLGLGSWWLYLTEIFGLFGLAILFASPRGRSWQVLALGVTFTLLGALPLLVRNALVTHWATFVHLLHPDAMVVGQQPDHPVPTQAWRTLVEIGFPALAGFHDARITPYRWAFPGSLVPALLYLAILGGAVFGLREAARSLPPEGRIAVLAPLGSALLMVAIYLFTRFGFEREPRYLLSLWVSFLGLYALACVGLERLRPGLGFAVCAFLMLHQAHQTFGLEQPMYVSAWNPRAPLNVSFAGLGSRLAAEGKTHIYADFWTAMRLTFDSSEEVISVDPNWVRNTELDQVVRSDPQSCWLSTPGHEADNFAATHGWRKWVFKDVPGLAETEVLACPN